MSNLNETLTMLATQLRCDAKMLIDFASEDNIGGYHIDEAQRKWPMGSQWGVEGQTLYALVRWLKPDNIVEIGGWVGASASHLALACKANGKGHVTSVDNGVGGQPHGYMIPAELREYVTLVNEDGRVWLAAQPPESIDLLFEDADHSTSLVTELTRLALVKIEAGGILASHDAGHDFAIVGGGVKIGSNVGSEVREGLAKAGAYFSVYLAEPSDCGLAITIIPGVRKVQEPLATDENPIVKVNGVDVHSSRLDNHLHTQDELQATVNAHFPEPGNSNIESMSEPPALKDASEEDTKPVKKTRKPRTPKVAK